MLEKTKKINKPIVVLLIVVSFWLLVAAPALALQLEDPLGLGGGADAPTKLYARIITGLLGVVGTLALVMFVWGGVQWMFSGGSPEKIKKGRDTLLWATLGMAVIFGSYILLEFIIRTLTGG